MRVFVYLLFVYLSLNKLNYMKKILLILFVFFYVNAFSQISVKEGSFHKIDGYLMLDRDDHRDINWKPMALIKLTTEGMTAEERARLIFKGNMATYFDVHQMGYETYVYLTAQAAEFVEIIHPDYGKTEFWFPEDLCDFCGYEMVVQYQPLAPKNGQEKSKINYLVVTADRPDASIYINGDLVGEKEISIPLTIGVKYNWKVECKYYHTESGDIIIKEGDANEINVVMRPAYGFIEVKTPEPGATVYIDGENVGKTPYKSNKLTSGDYKVRVVKEMYKTVEQVVTVTDNNTATAYIEMPANFVNITVNTDPDSEIYLDNIYKAKGTWSGRLSEGTHYFEARKASHEASGKNVTLVLGQDQTVTIDAPKPIYGFLSINSDPMRADIYIDGVHYGQTPKVINELLVGSHELVLKKDGCTDAKRIINIEKDQTLNIKEILSTGREISIKTGANNDQVYINGDYAGLTPLNIILPYGTHSVMLKRGSQTISKTINVSMSNSSQKDFFFTFGKIIEITSSKSGDEIYINGEYRGKTPAKFDFELGKYTIKVKRGKMEETKTVSITNSSSSSIYFSPREESLYEYLKYGVNFVTVNAAYSIMPQTSFGITFGSVDEFGWYASLMSNFNFNGMGNPSTQTGTVMLTGESCSTRISATAGVVILLTEPLYVRAGLGYGMRMKYWKTNNDYWALYELDTYKGLDLTAGVMLNTKKVSYSFDVVTTNFKTMEFKLGIGLNWKK